MAGLVGEELKELSFDFDKPLSRGLGFFSSGAFKSVILKFQSTLRSIRLSGLNCIQDSSPAAQNCPVQFPNLKSLILDNCQRSIFQTFSGIESCPQLQILSIKSQNSAQEPFECLLSLIKKQSHSLMSITFDPRFSYRSTISIPSEEISISFPALKEIEIRTDPEQNIFDSFTRFSYPSLIELRPSQLKERFQKITPKLVKDEGKQSD